VNDENWHVIVCETVRPVQEYAAELLWSVWFALHWFTTWVGPRTEWYPNAVLVPVDGQQPRAAGALAVDGRPGAFADDQRLCARSENVRPKSHTLAASDGHLPDATAGIE